MQQLFIDILLKNNIKSYEHNHNTSPKTFIFWFYASVNKLWYIKRTFKSNLSIIFLLISIILGLCQIRKYFRAQNDVDTREWSCSLCPPGNISPRCWFQKACTLLQGMSQLLNTQFGTCKRISPVNSSWRSCETRHRLNSRVGDKGYGQLSADCTKWVRCPPPTTSISMKDIRRSCGPSVTHTTYTLLCTNWPRPETESGVKSAAVFRNLLRRHNQPNQSSQAAIFVFGTPDSYT